MKVNVAIFLRKHEHHIAARALIAYVTAWKCEKADKPANNRGWRVLRVLNGSDVADLSLCSGDLLNMKHMQGPSEIGYLNLQ